MKIPSKQKFENRRISIPVEGKGHTSGILSVPERSHRKAAVIIGHGAGNDMNTPLIANLADGLAASGYPVLRFNFLYKEHGRKAPDTGETLIRTYQSAYGALKEASSNVDTWIAAGKSMGGRIAAQMVANGILQVDRLIFLGYPLHPANNKETLRDTHLYRIKIPMLFFAGTRDPLCDLGRLQTVLKKLQGAWDLYTIEGGDHSFHVPKSMGTTDEEIYQKIIEKSVTWLSQVPT